MTGKFYLASLWPRPLLLWQFVCDDTSSTTSTTDIADATYQKKIPFPLIAQLVRDALLEPDGSAHKSFCHARADGILPTVLSSTYDKLAHLPPAVSEAFLAEGADRLRQVFPDTRRRWTTRSPPHCATSRSSCWTVRSSSGCPIASGRRGNARAVCWAARDWWPCTAHRPGVALATDPDGESQRRPPGAGPAAAGTPGLPGPRLWLADRQFCDLVQTAAFIAEGGDHFLVRYHSKVHFYPDPARPAQQGQDGQGRAYEQEWGWLGGERDKRRRYVRRVTLHRDGEEDVILVTDLLDADATRPRTCWPCTWRVGESSACSNRSPKYFTSSG